MPEDMGHIEIRLSPSGWDRVLQAENWVLEAMDSDPGTAVSCDLVHCSRHMGSAGNMDTWAVMTGVADRASLGLEDRQTEGCSSRLVDILAERIGLRVDSHLVFVRADMGHTRF